MQRIHILLLWLGVCLIAHSWGCKTRKGAAKTASVDARAAEINAILDSMDMEDAGDLEQASTVFQGSYPRLFKLIHTRLQLRPIWDSAQMEGTATLTLCPWFFPQERLILDAKGFRVHSVSVAGMDSIAYEYSDRLHLILQFPKAVAYGDTLQVEIRYTACPEEVGGKGSAAIREAKGLYFINPSGQDPDKPRQLWTQGETEASSCWFPTLDAPNQKTTQEVYITVPDSFISLSNGKLINSERHSDGSRTDYWKQDLPHAPYLFMLASGRFDKVEAFWRGIPVSYYLEPSHAQYAEMIFGNTPEMLDFYSTIFGYAYPWDKYAQIVVRDFVSGAMENTGAVIHYDGLQHDSISHNDATHEDIIAHELAHHWFGDLVTAESWAQISMNESFATYSEYLWIAHKYGQSEADMHLEQDLSVYLAESRVKQKPLVRHCYTSREEVFDSHSYQKGSTLLHYLRSLLGDAAFFAALKTYLQRHAYATGEADQMRLIMEEISGRDLKKWFDQFFFSSGHPVVEVSYRTDSAANYSEIRVVQKSTPEVHGVYDLQFTAALYYADGSMDTMVLQLHNQDSTFRIATPIKPECIVLDNRSVLPGEIYEQRDVSEWLYILSHGSSDRLKIRALEQLMADLDEDRIATAVLQASLNRDNWYGLRVTALEALQFYSGNQMDEIVSTAITLSADPHVQVRSAAIDLLKSYLETQEIDSLSAELKATLYAVFNRGIADSSYYTRGYALTGLYTLDSAQGLEAAQSLTAYTDDGIAGSVVRILRKSSSPLLNDYLIKLIRNARSSYSQIVFMSLLYGNMNESLTDDDKVKIFAIFRDHAQFGSNPNRRLQSINMLQGMSEEYPEYKETIRNFFVGRQSLEKDEVVRERIDAYLRE